MDYLGCLDEDYRQFAIETCANAVRLYANGHFEHIKELHPLLDVDALMYWLGGVPSSHIASMMKDPQLLRSTVAYEDFACRIISVQMYKSAYMKNNIRKACISDMQDILRIQRMCYVPSLLEDEAVFRKIIEQDMSYVAFDLLDNQSVVGYALVHGIPNEYAPPSLNTTILDASDAVDVWNASDVRDVWAGHVFIHDVSVAPEWRGKGLASQMVYEIIDRASEAKSISLTSVQDSQKFWENHGFTKVDEGTRATWINSYGEDAVHMTKNMRILS